MLELGEVEREEIAREIKILATLRHEGIIRYEANFVEGDVMHIVMEYASGGALSDRLTSGEPMEEDRIWETFVQIVHAMRYVHRCRVLHRDLKPQNVLLAGPQQRIVKLADFGIAKVLGPRDDAAGTLVGTPHYMSPELCEGKAADDRSDVWALGCLLYELCAGKKPFEGNSVPSIVFSIMRNRPDPLPSHFSDELRALVAFLLQPRPEERPSMEHIAMMPIVRQHWKRWQSVCRRLSRPLPRPPRGPDDDGKGGGGGRPHAGGGGGGGGGGDKDGKEVDSKSSDASGSGPTPVMESAGPPPPMDDVGSMMPEDGMATQMLDRPYVRDLEGKEEEYFEGGEEEEEEYFEGGEEEEGGERVEGEENGGVKVSTSKSIPRASMATARALGAPLDLPAGLLVAEMHAVDEDEMGASEASSPSEREAVVLSELQNAKMDAATASGSEAKAALEARLTRMSTVLASEEDVSGRVWEALGRAWAEAGDFANAIRAYRIAITRPAERGASLQTREQLGNLLVRRAQQVCAMADNGNVEEAEAEAERISDTGGVMGGGGGGGGGGGVLRFSTAAGPSSSPPQNIQSSGGGASSPSSPPPPKSIQSSGGGASSAPPPKSIQSSGGEPRWKSMARALMLEGLGMLERICMLEDTAERRSLLGSAYKRRAWTALGEDRRRDLEAAADNYGQAHRLELTNTTGAPSPYARLNELTLAALAASGDEEWRIQAVDDAREALSWAKEWRGKHPEDTWRWVQVADAKCLRFLLGDREDGNTSEAVARAYRDQFVFGASQRVRSSVMDQLRFLQVVLEDRDDAWSNALLRRVHRLTRRLTRHASEAQISLDAVSTPEDHARRFSKRHLSHDETLAEHPENEHRPSSPSSTTSSSSTLSDQSQVRPAGGSHLDDLPPTSTTPKKSSSPPRSSVAPLGADLAATENTHAATSVADNPFSVAAGRRTNGITSTSTSTSKHLPANINPFSTAAAFRRVPPLAILQQSLGQSPPKTTPESPQKTTPQKTTPQKTHPSSKPPMAPTPQTSSPPRPKKTLAARSGSQRSTSSSHINLAKGETHEEHSEASRFAKRDITDLYEKKPSPSPQAAPTKKEKEPSVDKEPEKAPTRTRLCVVS